LGLGFDFRCLEIFHLGFLWPHLYACNSLALKWEIHLFFWLPFDHLAWDPFDVHVWHLFLLFLQWCFIFPPQGGATTHGETRVHLWHFLTNNWKDLQVSIFI
jgi:hypothetical protein